MFFHTSVLSTSGPLGQMWLSAHLKRNKLHKRQIQGISIKQYSQVILKPKDGPMALRLSGQLLLGLVRIYSLKVRYLHEECSNSYSKMRLQRSKVYLEPGQNSAAANSAAAAAEVNLDDLVMANVVMNPDEDLLNGDLFFVDGDLAGLGGDEDAAAGAGFDASVGLDESSRVAGISVVRGEQSMVAGLEAVREASASFLRPGASGPGDLQDLSLLGGDADKSLGDLLSGGAGQAGPVDDDDLMMLDFGDLGGPAGGEGDARGGAGPADDDVFIMDLGGDDDDYQAIVQVKEEPLDDEAGDHAQDAYTYGAGQGLGDSLDVENLVQGGLGDLPMPGDDLEEAAAEQLALPLSGRKRRRPQADDAGDAGAESEAEGGSAGAGAEAEADADAGAPGRRPSARARARDDEAVVIPVAASAAELRRIPEARRERPDAAVELGRDQFVSHWEARSDTWGWSKRARLAAQLANPELLGQPAGAASGSAVGLQAILGAASAAALGRDLPAVASGVRGGEAVVVDSSEDELEGTAGALRGASRGDGDADEEPALEDYDNQVVDAAGMDMDLADMELAPEDADLLIVEDDEMPPLDGPADLDLAWPAGEGAEDRGGDIGTEEAKEDQEASFVLGDDKDNLGSSGAAGDQPTKARVLQAIQAGAGSSSASAASFEKHIAREFDPQWRAQVFYKLLELKTQGAVEVQQEHAYGDIKVQLVAPVA